MIPSCLLVIIHLYTSAQATLLSTAGTSALSALNVTVSPSPAGPGTGEGDAGWMEPVTREYCSTETFHAHCPPGWVILMLKALYGRMRLGRCVRVDFGFIGCSSDVLGVFDGLCSGRKECRLRVPDVLLDQTKTCLRDLTSYLETSYQCVKVDTGEGEGCGIEGGRRTLPLLHPRGYLFGPSRVDSPSSIRDHPPNPRDHPPSPLGSMPGVSGACTRSLTALPGQRINLTLINLGAWRLGLPEGGHDSLLHHRAPPCRRLALVTDLVAKTDIDVCSAPLRISHTYLSAGHALEIRLLREGRKGDGDLFLIHYEVVGCEELRLLPQYWVEPMGDHDLDARVGCRTSVFTWSLMCKDRVWIGEIGNCSVKVIERVDELTTSALPYREEIHMLVEATPLPTGLAVLIVITIALMVSLCVSTAGILLIRKCRQITSGAHTDSLLHHQRPEDVALKFLSLHSNSPLRLVHVDHVCTTPHCKIQCYHSPTHHITGDSWCERRCQCGEGDGCGEGVYNSRQSSLSPPQNTKQTLNNKRMEHKNIEQEQYNSEQGVVDDNDTECMPSNQTIHTNTSPLHNTSSSSPLIRHVYYNNSCHSNSLTNQRLGKIQNSQSSPTKVLLIPSRSSPIHQHNISDIINHVNDSRFNYDATNGQGTASKLGDSYYNEPNNELIYQQVSRAIFHSNAINTSSICTCGITELDIRNQINSSHNNLDNGVNSTTSHLQIDTDESGQMQNSVCPHYNHYALCNALVISNHSPDGNSYDRTDQSLGILSPLSVSNDRNIAKSLKNNDSDIVSCLGGVATSNSNTICTVLPEDRKDKKLSKQVKFTFDSDKIDNDNDDSERLVVQSEDGDTQKITLYFTDGTASSTCKT